MSLFNLLPAVITAGGSLSAEVGLGEGTLCGIYMPLVWTAASVTFQVSPDDATWYEHYNGAGTETTLTVAAGQYIALDPVLWRGVNLIKVRSGTSASPVNQSAAATLTLVARRLF